MFNLKFLKFNCGIFFLLLIIPCNGSFSFNYTVQPGYTLYFEYFKATLPTSQSLCKNMGRKLLYSKENFNEQVILNALWWVKTTNYSYPESHLNTRIWTNAYVDNGKFYWNEPSLADRSVTYTNWDDGEPANGSIGISIICNNVTCRWKGERSINMMHRFICIDDRSDTTTVASTAIVMIVGLSLAGLFLSMLIIGILWFILWKKQFLCFSKITRSDSDESLISDENYSNNNCDNGYDEIFTDIEEPVYNLYDRISEDNTGINAIAINNNQTISTDVTAPTVEINTNNLIFLNSENNTNGNICENIDKDTGRSSNNENKYHTITNNSINDNNTNFYRNKNTNKNP